MSIEVIIIIIAQIHKHDQTAQVIIVEGIKHFKKSKLENNKIQQSWAKKINSTPSTKPHTILIKAKG